MTRTGQKLWKNAKTLIPGGNMLLSKRAEMFLPDNWPAYYSKAKGCHVWDMDNTKLVDTCIMGIGTNILGYGDDEVDEVVKKTVENGNMSTLNCPEEVWLAEKLIAMHEWAEMVRYARTGGEANSIAIRIARAATGRDVVAICGYHGWHDWYLATNLSNESGLEDHLLPGLEPRGVPKGLEGSVQPFSFNKFEQLEELSNKYQLAAVKMEVERSTPPAKGFLEAVRKLCDSKGIILIFDECTSGFRETFGGIHLKYGIDPDMAIFGKALGNGYAITSVIGRRSVMEYAQNTFISSTFWTERIGPSAALKTLEVMSSKKSWEIITKQGRYIKSGWEELGRTYQLPIVTSGIPAIAAFSFNCEDGLKYKTLVTQEMLKRNYLASNIIFSSVAHTRTILDDYFNNLDEIFATIQKCENAELNIDNLLDGEVCHSGFKRLN